jgi:superfamily II DNA/RNA helicase
MSFKKLNPPLKEALQRLELQTPLAFQKEILPKIKSGRDLFIIAPENSGKTTALVISTIQKLESAAFEDAPRALIYVEDKEAALALEEEFNKFIKYMDLRVYSAYDAPNIETQKDAIYDGVDIVIATPNKLFASLSNRQNYQWFRYAID